MRIHGFQLGDGKWLVKIQHDCWRGKREIGTFSEPMIAAAEILLTAYGKPAPAAIVNAFDEQVIAPKMADPDHPSWSISGEDIESFVQDQLEWSA